MRLGQVPIIKTHLDIERNPINVKYPQNVKGNYLTVPSVKRQKQVSQTPTFMAKEARKFLSPLSLVSAAKKKKKIRLPPLNMFSTFQVPVTG
jgi:hypothetical protein